MEKKLPSVFANKVTKNVGNNKKVFYSSNDTDEFSANERRSLGGGAGSGAEAGAGAGAGVGVGAMGSRSQVKYKNINQKINAIFNSPNYIYKADVDITLKDGKITKKIVGKNRTHLITIENELIPLTDIIDIERK